MKKRNLKYIFENVYWHLLCLLPFLAYGIYLLSYQLISASEVLPTFTVFCQQQLLSFDVSNIVYSTFVDIFGNSGLVPLFADGSPILWYASYVVCISIVRLCVDFLTWLPDLCHKFKEKLCRGD